MKIVASKNNLFNMDSFLNDSNNKDYVTGLFINIATTKNNHLIVFDYVNNNYSDLVNVEEQTFDDIHNESIFSLEELLQKLITTNVQKDIYLNLLLNFNIIDNKKIDSYIEQVFCIIDKYPTISFHLCSNNQNLLANLKTYDRNYPIGYIIGPGGYIDVDFYIFSIHFLNTKILNEQHALQKGMLIQLLDWADLQYVCNFLEKEKDFLTNGLCEKISYIGAYPDIIHNSLKNK